MPRRTFSQCSPRSQKLNRAECTATHDKDSSSADQIYQREKRAFEKLRPELLKDPNYKQKYVAIINGKVVDSDFDETALAIRVYQTHGYISLYAGKVTEEKEYLKLSSPE